MSNLGLLLAVVNHQIDLAKLQSMVTQQSEHDGAPSPMLVVVIDKMKVVNSPASHKQLREVFQLTQACIAPAQCSVCCHLIQKGQTLTTRLTS